jgi:O-antigen/teichoic acid export membrane protein
MEDHLVSFALSIGFGFAFILIPFAIPGREFFVWRILSVAMGLVILFSLIKGMIQEWKELKEEK